MTDIAIVGMDCRFPGADNPAQLWDLTMRGGDGITDVPPPRWRLDGLYDPDGGPNTTNTRSAGFISDPDAFDHAFFGFSADEAAQSDPQLRLLLQTAWRALEDACLDPRAQARSRTGVYVGIMNSDWLSLVTTDLPGLTRDTGATNGYSMMANRVSFALDLAGPSMAIDTFCSSSLVATQLACASLRAGETDQALVGGVSVLVTPSFSVFITQAGLSAPDGRCKPFSVRADGFGRAEGVAVVVLRRLDDALADGLPVYAVITGGAVNHGGRAARPTTPSPRAQRDVMSEAYRRADVRPQDIAFVEAHATGTPVGDRIEASALGHVHGVPRDRPCAVGSIKGNIAHAEGAAGVASLIKAALALQHKVVPPSRYADSENPRLRLAENGLALIREPLKLPQTDVCAGVSAFGLGGTNAHLVLVSAPGRPQAPAACSRASAVLTVSSDTPAGLHGAVRALRDDMARRPPDSVAQLSWTSNTVKSSGTVRFALPVTDMGAALPAMAEAVRDASRLGELSGRCGDPAVMAWLVPGAGTEYPAMSAGLYQACPPYRRALAAVDEVLEPYLGGSVRDLLFAGGESIHQPERAGPAMFAVGYALGKTLHSLGLLPAWILARGAGEYAAAALAGMLSLADACRLVTAAARPAPLDNGRALGGVAEAVTGRPADIPVYSARSGGLLGAEVPRAGCWRPAGGVSSRLPEAIAAAAGAQPTATHLVELGPASGLAAAVATVAGGHQLPCLRPASRAQATGGDLTEVVAALYRDGFAPCWDELYQPDQRIRHRLTPYQFALSARFWRPTAARAADIGSPQPGIVPLSAQVRGLYAAFSAGHWRQPRPRAGNRPVVRCRGRLRGRHPPPLPGA